MTHCLNKDQETILYTFTTSQCSEGSAQSSRRVQQRLPWGRDKQHDVEQWSRIMTGHVTVAG